MICEVRLELRPDRAVWEFVRSGSGRSLRGDRESEFRSGAMWLEVK